MKRCIALAVCASLLAFASCSAKKPASDDVNASAATPAAVDSVAVAKDVVDALAAGDTAKVVGKFDAQMAAALPAAQLSQVWSGVQAQYGPYKSQAGTRTEKVQGVDAVFVTCQFERGKVDVQVTVDKEGKVSGLFIRPSQA
jgi:hypothetical protein